METYDPKKDCCPKFDPAPWDGKTFTWQGKKFIKGRVACAFNIPLTFGSAMKKLQAQVDKASATMLDYLALSDHTSKWSMDLYVAVDKDVPGAHNVSVSGTFLCKVYEGKFQDTGKWCADFAEYAKQQGYATIQKWYMWYTTCPKCATKYGKNYVAIFGQVM